MKHNKNCFSPIGVIRTTHKLAEKTPIQPNYASEFTGHIELLSEYSQGLEDLEGFSHINPTQLNSER